MNLNTNIYYIAKKKNHEKIRINISNHSIYSNCTKRCQ